MKSCRVCGHTVQPFMSFGQMPVGNAFLVEEEFSTEYFFELEPASCMNCSTFQIIDVPEPQRMFHDHYAYFASTSSVMTDHFRSLAQHVMDDLVQSDDPFIVEIGSNDGISLQHYAKAGVRHLGVDPSKNVSKAAANKGVTTVCAFFNEETAKSITKEYGPADIIISTNTMHHIEDIRTVVTGAKILLKQKGLMITEDPYLGDMFRLGAYEQIYAEHNFIWSLMSMQFLFNLYDMEIVNIDRNHYHGGCMRYFIGHKGEHLVSDAVETQLTKEKVLGLDKTETFEKFRSDCETSRQSLVQLLKDLRLRGKRVVGYGATAKSTTLLNYCGITRDHLEFICDSTFAKQGRFTPGSHIPIYSDKVFKEAYPDYALLLAWNHREEIFSKERAYIDNGGKWIEYIPELKIT